MKGNGDHSYQAKFPVNALRFYISQTNCFKTWPCGLVYFLVPIHSQGVAFLQIISSTRFDHHLLTLMSSFEVQKMFSVEYTLFSIQKNKWWHYQATFPVNNIFNLSFTHKWLQNNSNLIHSHRD